MEAAKQKKNTGHVSKDQKQALLDFIEMNPAIKTGKFSQNFTYKDASLMWENAAKYFNSIPGSKKDWQSWRKCWHDLKNDVRSKASKIKSYEIGTGGGPSSKITLNDFEERVQEIIGKTCITGHDIKESNVLLDLPYKSDQSEKENFVVEFLESDSELDGDDPGPSTSKRSTTSVREQLGISNKWKSQSPKYQARKRHPSSSQRVDNCVKTANTISENICFKNAMKETYYKRKIELMERNVIANEDKARAKERTADILQSMEKSVANIAQAFTKISKSYD